MGYRIGVDIGGTFTDCVVVDGEGNRSISKALTTTGELGQGVLDAVQLNAEGLGMSRGDLLADTELFVHGTTQATNAILTRTGARTGLITTKGHEDVLPIGRVYSKMAGLPERDLVHASRLAKPEPIVPKERIHGVTERIDREGEVVVALNEDEVGAAIDALLADEVEAIAVSLLWSFVNDAHERRVKELLAERADGVMTVFSHEIAPVMGEYERTATTAITAYVGPKVVAYLETLESRLQDDGMKTPLLLMQASGGLTSVMDAASQPIVTLDSGPTGGVLGCQHLGELYGESNVVCTDVGGTSFDVGLILRGQVPLDVDPVIAQYTLRTPKILINSIGSGGGSIAWLDEGGLLRVGSQSAGSRPGPACYGLGGEEPTVTDADLVLGYLDPEGFLGGRMRLDRDLAMKALGRLGERLGMEPEEVAMGVFRIINAHMADLIRKSTIEQGHDPRDCILVAYGGAGPTHAVFYGRDIGSKAILVLANSTVFSAEGMLTCDVTHHEEVSRAVASPFDAEDCRGITERFEALEQRVLDQFEREGTPREEISLARTLGVRFRAQVQGLPIEVEGGEFSTETGAELLDRFLRRYAEVYGEGAVLGGGDIEIDLHRVVGTRAVEPLVFRKHPDEGVDPAAALKRERTAYFEPAGYQPTAVYAGDELRAGNVVGGPAIIERMGDSVVVPADYEATVDRYLTLRLNLAGGEGTGATVGAAEAAG
jgi:N-methylhydantoinase A/oxoprolinase/acetone carboxylase beta subunit